MVQGEQRILAPWPDFFGTKPMIDLHCHILPEVDDGATDMTEAVEMARLAAADGIRTIVATPHIKEALLPAPLIRQAVQDLNRQLAAEEIPLEILPGGDVSALLHPDLLAGYTINQTNYILIEFPHSHLPANAGEILFNLRLRGFRPIITHPERNPSIIRQPELLCDLVRDPEVHVQITGASLTGDFGPDTQECACHLLEKKMVDFIATDGHSSRHRRPLLSRALKVAEGILGKSAAQKLVAANPAAIIKGEPLAS